MGILGKEGQQAARSADFAIGQFKFLKPLMFVHGREAYRRNSLLILYTFYKNVLYVTAQFFHGFLSAFSGQTLYEAFIYQLYNIAFTAIPIMYFALFDFECDKDYSPLVDKNPNRRYFLKHPSLYKIGMENRNFSIMHYLKWMAYGFFHAFLTYVFNCYLMLIPGQQLTDGKDMGFWVAGHIVYGVCVIVANLVITQ